MTTETKQIDEGGAAFPVHGMDVQTGMTRRQWLAGMAMQAQLSLTELHSAIASGAVNALEVCLASYQWADQMIAAEKGGK